MFLHFIKIGSNIIILLSCVVVCYQLGEYNLIKQFQVAFKNHEKKWVTISNVSFMKNRGFAHVE